MDFPSHGDHPPQPSPEDREKEIMDKQIRDFAHHFFVDIKNGKYAERKDLHSSVFLNFVKNKLDVIANDDSAAMGYITDKIQAATGVFCDELVAFLKEIKQTEEAGIVEEFTYQIGQALFSGSPNLTERLSPADHMHFLARVGRMPESKSMVSQGMIFELGSQMVVGFGRDDYEKIYEKLSHATVAEQLEALHILERVLLVSEGGGTGYDAEVTGARIMLLAQRFAQESQYPLVAARAELVVDLCDRAGGDFFELAARRRAAEYTNNREQAEPVDVVFSDPTNLPFSKKEDEDDRVLFEEMRRGDMAEFLNQQFGMQVEELSLRAQIQLLEFLSHQGSDVLQTVGKLMNEENGLDKKAFLESFFACAEDKKSGDALVTFARDSGPEKANIVFRKYQDLIAQLNGIEKTVQDYFTTGKNVDTRLVVQAFVKRANQVLLSAVEKAGKLDVKELEEKIAGIKADVLLFAVSFKQASTDGKIEFEELKGVNFESKDSSELTEAEKEEMLRIFVENRPGYAPALLEKTKGEFEEALNSGGSKFYLVCHGSTIMSFIRFDDLGNNRLYGGSLNVRTEARGSAIGSALMATVMDKEGMYNTIEAVVYSKNPMLKHYVEDFGCQIIGEIEDFEGTGERYYQLERPPKISSMPESVHSDSEGDDQLRRAA